MSVAYVYLVQAKESGRLKIGKADDPAKRLAGLQTGSPEPLVMLFAIRIQTDSQAACRNQAAKLEKDLHKRFAPMRLHGEWFRESTTITNEFERLFRWRNGSNQ